MRTLVIGGSGLIGSAVTNSLLRRGHQVVVFDRGSRGAPVPADAEVIRGDRTNHTQFRELLRAQQDIDGIVDMACFTPEDARGLVETFRGRVRRVVMCSTVEVYSARRTDSRPITESFPTHPTNDYGRGKIAAERVLRVAELEDAFEVTIVRPAYTFGEPGALLSAFQGDLPDRLLAGRAIVVPDDGQKSWVVCHRDDVALAIATALESPAAGGSTYNVTGIEQMSWDAYFFSIAGALGAPRPTLVHIPLSLLVRAAPHIFAQRIFIFESHYSFDVGAARRDLAFLPAPWTCGLQRMVKAFAERGELRPPTELTLEDAVVRCWLETSDRFVANLRSEA